MKKEIGCKMPQNNENVCHWQFDNIDEAYHTDCDDMFVFCNDGSLEDNHFFHCPNCGRKIEEITKDENDEN